LRIRCSRKIFGPKWDEVTGEWRRLSYLYSSAKYYLVHQIKKYEMDGSCSMYGREVHVGFWWENPRERECLEYPGVVGATY
jgi:hypothetical protein